MDSSIIPEGPINEVDAPIVENKKCKKVNSRKTRWQKEFCAGRRDGSGPCIGNLIILWASLKLLGLLDFESSPKQKIVNIEGFSG